MKLNVTASRAIREAGFTKAQWAAMWGYAGGEWGGDACGCFDDRCIGYHHEGEAGCGCLETMLDDAVAWRQASRYPNSVELVGRPYGLFQWVDVSTPGVLARVSTSQGGTGPRVNGVVQARPAESVIEIEAREGWTAEVTTGQDGRITIRLVNGGAR